MKAKTIIAIGATVLGFVMFANLAHYLNTGGFRDVDIVSVAVFYIAPAGILAYGLHKRAKENKAKAIAP